MAALEDLRSVIMKNPETLASYEAEKAALVKEMAEWKKSAGKKETTEAERSAERRFHVSAG